MDAGLHFIRGQVGLRMILLTVAVLLCVPMVSLTHAQAPQPGLGNGFEIDGNLYSNNPGGTVSLGNDWLDGSSGPGTGILFPDGSPKDPLITLHILDLVKNDDQDIFGKSTKLVGDPNLYAWKGGSVPQKDDIQNGFIHLTEDESGNLWVTVGGDRRSVSGTSYIDFEFLQNTLTKNPDGSFTSDGPHGGRTIGDVVLTITLTNGGAQAVFSAQRWESDGAGGYTYVVVPFPAGSAYVAANVDSIVTTTYDAFGNGHYEINQFGEAMANLNTLLPEFGECFAIATVFVRTKSSASASADLKDFIEPFQLNKCLDETAPVLTCPTELTVPCTAATSPDDLGWPFATDECGDPGIAFVDSVAPGACAQEYTVFRTWTVTDVCGNATSCVQIIHVVDDTPPEIVSGPGPLTVQCPGDVPVPDDNLITATDDCGGVSVTHMSDVSDGNTCPEIITRTYQAVDDCGNATTFVQLITIHDTTPPTVSPIEMVTVECSDNVPPPDINVVAATDNCGPVTVSHVGDTSDGNTCPETITRTYRAVDGCGNVTEIPQTIRVHDTTAPEVVGPEDMTLECHDEIPSADIGLIAATDNCGSVTVTHVGDVSDGISCPERITRTYRATDECGNATDHVQVFTIDDTTPPEISGPADVDVECRGDIPAADINLITATDNCGNVTVTHVGDTSDGNTCPEHVTRTYRATDDCGNTADFTQIISIRDETDPVAACAGPVTVECVGDVPPADIRDVAATDNCGHVTVVHHGDFSDGQSCPETISRVYRITDDCGNMVECIQTITVIDTTPPSVDSGPGPITVQCNDDVPPPSIGLISATDNCGNPTVMHMDDFSDGNVCPEVITRVYRIYDDCFNSTDFVQTITIDDDTPPEITSCPSDEMVECPDILVFGEPTAIDNCDPNPTLVMVEEDSVLGSEPWTFSAIRKWVAADYCGNTSDECTQRISYKCEVDALCTHTQGFYGNYGGTFNYMPTLEIIQAALSQSALVVGLDGRSLRIPFKSAHCIIERLPAGTTPTTLSYTGNSTLRDSDCIASPKAVPLDSNGKFENVLLGQTITLGLNMRVNSPLFLFPLSEEFCTQPALPGPDGLYGTEDDVLNTNAPIGHYTIAPSVLAAITELGLWPTVQGLYDLANRALGGGYTAGATIPEINNAVDAINRGFDGCRFIVECNSKTSSLPDLRGGSESDDAVPVEPVVNLPTRFDLGQNYPNPFNPNTRITIAVPEAVSWTLHIYNVAGQLIRRFHGSTSGPAFVDVNWDGRDTSGRPVATGMYLYRVKAGGFTNVKKMILIK
ncbi:MAG: T9SS type A sorting domain-containing protein [Candidatus Latescibacterota bacterium]|nr:MAG: T9SS type A sorting domain-containing protein [Candidatus Latescibacterota bacterium]